MTIPTSFDFIICGGGTAGLVLANRLSENANHSVLVIEAGEDHANDPLIETPAAFPQTLGNPKYDWDFKTVPQPHTANAVHHWPRGKGLGGTSAINLMNYSHCSRGDLDEWAELGNDGWGFDEMTAYMRRAETVHVPSNEIAEAFNPEWIMPELRGKEGPIQVAYPGGHVSWAQEIVKDQGKNMSYPQSKDPRGGSSIGLFNQYCAINPVTNTRSYSANTYLKLARERPNLTVWTSSLVSKVKFERTREGNDPRAQGVLLEREGRMVEVHASKEVVICAGTVQSPQLLELSGVGCPKLLGAYDIPVVVENSHVGENMQDHAMVPQCWAVKANVPTNETFRDHPELLQKEMEFYQKEQRGFFASVLCGSGFVDLERMAPDMMDYNRLVENSAELPSCQKKALLRQLAHSDEAVLQFQYGATGCDTTDRSALGRMTLHSIPGNYFTWFTSLCHPWSRGSVHIQSADVHTPPVIDPKYLSHAMDLEILAHGELHMNKLVNTAPLSDYLLDDPDAEKKRKVPMPGFKNFDTLEGARESVRDHVISHYHPCGTCAMLPREDGGVVNSTLEVYGTEGLRVVDASIFPMQVQGNIQSMVYAVAEKAADMIRAKYAGGQ